MGTSQPIPPDMRGYIERLLGHANVPANEGRIAGLYETLNHYLSRRPEELRNIRNVWLSLGTQSYDISWVLSEVRKVPDGDLGWVPGDDAYTVRFGKEEEP
jgi:hypothetical protein